MKAASTLDLECRAFTRYLLRADPDPYVVGKYVDAHDATAVFRLGTRFDTYLLRLARTHHSLAQAADSYARLFAPRSLLRRKLVLLLAILETSGSSAAALDTIPERHPGVLVAGLLAAGTVSVLSLMAGLIMFLPAQVILAAVGRRATQ